MTVADTSFLIAVARGEERAARWLAGAEERHEVLAVPAVVLMEYLVGFDADEQPHQHRALHERARVVPFDGATALEAAALQRRSLAAGRRLAWTDCQIAATALVLREPLLTFDADFASIAGLEVIRP